MRPLEPADAEVVALLAAELNRHQGDPDDLFTPDVVLRDAFGPERRFTGLVATYRGEVVGYALLLPAYETGWGVAGAYICDLCVTEAARGRGVGRSLVAACAAEARRNGRQFLWWATRAWNTAAQEFYRRLGAFDEALHAHVLPPQRFDELAAAGERYLTGGGRADAVCASNASD